MIYASGVWKMALWIFWYDDLPDAENVIWDCWFIDGSRGFPSKPRSDQGNNVRLKRLDIGRYELTEISGHCSDRWAHAMQIK